jgi:hypothetical protein
MKMKFTAEDVKKCLSFDRRIFFVSPFSEQEEERRVINYEATAEALNKLNKEFHTSIHYQSAIEFLKRKLERAEGALTRAGFQDLGGEHWKPPVNEAAGELFRLKAILRRVSE